MADDETIQTRVPPTGDAAPGARRATPAKLGRYLVRRLLGRGGVGAVYEADDPELGRRVAIKVLRDDRAGDTEELRHEAQALALLVHPNVVAVFDVGVADGEVFVVMQLVDGHPIDVWLSARDAPPAAILDAYLQAGEGLAAAHAANLVHCDFKPGNVLVDKTGAVRVTDFGLARAHRSDDAPAATTGMFAIAGTPAYMAPEQFEGSITAACDQFAFSVALWEALAGVRPYDDPSIAVPDADRVRARVRRADDKLPPRIAKVLARGLAPVAADRFPSMRALLDALRPPVARRRSFEILGGGAIVAGAIVAVVALRGGHADEEPGPGWQGADPAHTRLVTTYGTTGCANSPTVTTGQVVYDLTLGDELDLYAVPLAGGTPRRLTSAPTVEWRAQPGRHPGEVVHLIHQRDQGLDGASIAYLDIATGVETTAMPKLAWDAVVVGDTLYYSPDQPAGLRKLTGSNDEELAQPPANRNFFLIAASPVGDRLAITSTETNEGVCLYDLHTNTTKCTKTRMSSARPAFGPDGKALYFNAADGIRRRDLATGREDVIAHDVWTEGGFTVTPDGRELLYSTCVGHSVMLDVDTGATLVDEDQTAHPTMSAGGALAWVRSVRTTAVVVVREPDGREIQLTNAEGNAVTVIAFDASGKRLVFTASQPHSGIFSARVDQPGVIAQLSDNPKDGNPAWTASGEVAFQRDEGEDGIHIYVVAATGGTPRRLGTSSRTLYASRGDELLVAQDSTLFWMDAKTGAERPGPAAPPGYLGWVSISPNRKWLLFQMGVYDQDLWRAQLDADGSARGLERVKQYSSITTVGPGAIRDDGHVLAAPSSWWGDIFSIPAKPDDHF